MKYAKAITAGLVAGLGSLGTALVEDSPGGAAVTAAEWVAVAIATVATAGAVFGVPNRTS